MLEYILNLFSRAVLYTIFAYWLYHFIVRLYEYSKTPPRKGTSAIMIIFLSLAYSLGRVVGRVKFILKI